VTGAVRLALWHLVHHWGRSAVIGACLTLTMALPMVSRAVTDAFERELHARAEGVPMVVGAKGSRFGLVFSALHFRRPESDTVPLSLYEELLADANADALPINVRFTARGRPVGEEPRSRAS